MSGRRMHGNNAGQALAAKQRPPLPLAAYKACSPPLLACVRLSSEPPWRPARGAHGLKPPWTKLSASSPPWTSTPTSRTVSCPAGGAASPVQRSRRPLPPAAGAPPRRPSHCPNRGHKPTPRDRHAVSRPTPGRPLSPAGWILAGAAPATAQGLHCKPPSFCKV
jgi:hypothetical protein